MMRYAYGMFFAIYTIPRFTKLSISYVTCMQIYTQPRSDLTVELCISASGSSGLQKHTKHTDLSRSQYFTKSVGVVYIREAVVRQVCPKKRITAASALSQAYTNVTTTYWSNQVVSLY